MRPEQFELIAKALADPRRVALLEAIASERSCGCTSLRRQFPVSKATISHHIKELVRAGLVTAERQGQFLNCRGAEGRAGGLHQCAAPARRQLTFFL